MQPNRLHLILLGILGLMVLSGPDPSASATPQAPPPVDYGDIATPGIAPGGSSVGAPAAPVETTAPAPEIPAPATPAPEDPVPEPSAPDEPAFAPPAVEELPAPPAPVASAAPEALVDHSFARSVFAVQCPNGDAGSAVAIGPQTLVTCHHVVERSGNTCQVTVNGQSYRATITRLPGGDNQKRDAALLTVQGVTLPHLSVRSPQYLEAARLFGLRTGYVTEGIVSADRTISLQPEFSRPQSGDSGGAVVGDDGQLIGIIVGGARDHQHVAYMTESGVFARSSERSARPPGELAFPDPVAPRAPHCGAPSAPQAPQQIRMTPNCHGGVCRPRGRAFRLFR